MKKSIVFITGLIFNCIVVAQSNKVLLTVNETPVYIDEFKQVYEKNLDLVTDESAKDIDNYLELYINYKLKVQEAYQLKLDTIASYRKELEGYKKELLAPYLQDKEFIESLVKEAYERTKFDVKASHILVRVPKNILPQDTLTYYNKINEARKRILQGENFEEVAKDVSEDPSATTNGGNLGYFNVFKMVYPFENAAYSTAKGNVSKPFKTRFGYHVIKVYDKRLSKGEFEVAHMLLRSENEKSKEKIEGIYKDIKEGKISFEDATKEFSEDLISAKNGGKLKRFGTGDMVEDFEKVVLSLEEENEISTPFKTQFGWHIVKLIKRHPVASFDELKSALNKKVRSSSRIKLSDKSMLDGLKETYKIQVNDKALQPFYNLEKNVDLDNNLKETLLVINEREILQKDFYKFIQRRKNYSVKELFNQFKNIEILNYFKDDLVQNNQEFRSVYLEYKEGLLLFELMQRKIWNESSKNKEGLEKYYQENRKKYAKELSEIRGKVMNDYQKDLEENWIEELRKKNIIKVKKGALKKLKKAYSKT